MKPYQLTDDYRLTADSKCYQIEKRRWSKKNEDWYWRAESFYSDIGAALAAFADLQVRTSDLPLPAALAEASKWLTKEREAIQQALGVK